MAISDATVAVTVKKKPFLWLWDISASISENNPKRIYTAGASEKLLFAKIWMVQPAAAKQFAFYKGDNAATIKISHDILTTNMSAIANDAKAMDPTVNHFKVLIGGDASEDFVMEWIAGTSETYAFHAQIFFEE
jgi:hypothetical protein